LLLIGGLAIRVLRPCWSNFTTHKLLGVRHVRAFLCPSSILNGDTYIERDELTARIFMAPEMHKSEIRSKMKRWYSIVCVRRVGFETKISHRTACVLKATLSTSCMRGHAWEFLEQIAVN
jgi:hypothetical protein